MTKKLPLTVPTGAIVQPATFEQSAIDTLTKWFDPAQIDCLRTAAENARHIAAYESTEPSLGDEKQVLARARELAFELSQILEQAPTHAAGALVGIAHSWFHDVYALDTMAGNLNTLTAGLDASIANLPKQGLRKSHADFVREIAGVCAVVGIKPSVSETSRFFAICSTVFVAAGMPQSPKGSIQAFIK